MKLNKPEQTYELKDMKEILKGFLGKEVILSIRSGDKLKGRLESVSTYELVITVSYKPVVVLKHAIDYVELAE
jgi:sRNA-binding regulator protein Hfq